MRRAPKKAKNSHIAVPLVNRSVSSMKPTATSPLIPLAERTRLTRKENNQMQEHQGRSPRRLSQSRQLTDEPAGADSHSGTGSLPGIRLTPRVTFRSLSGVKNTGVEAISYSRQTIPLADTKSEVQLPSRRH